MLNRYLSYISEKKVSELSPIFFLGLMTTITYGGEVQLFSNANL